MTALDHDLTGHTLAVLWNSLDARLLERQNRVGQLIHELGSCMRILAQLCAYAIAGFTAYSTAACASHRLVQFDVQTQLLSERLEGGAEPVRGAQALLSELGLSAESDTNGVVRIRGQAAEGCYWVLVRRIGFEYHFTELLVAESGSAIASPLFLKTLTVPEWYGVRLAGPCKRTDSLPWP